MCLSVRTNVRPSLTLRILGSKSLKASFQEGTLYNMKYYKTLLPDIVLRKLCLNVIFTPKKCS